MFNIIKQWAIDIWEHPTKLDNGAAIVLVAVLVGMVHLIILNVM